MSNRILEMFRRDAEGVDWPRANWRAWLDDETRGGDYTQMEFEFALHVLTRLSLLDAVAQFDEGWDAGIRGRHPADHVTAEFTAGWNAGYATLLADEKRWEQAS